MEEKAFSTISVAQRPGKPRQKGLTMLIDWGLGLITQGDWLEIGGDYVDLAKVAVGASRLISADLLRRKLDLYRAQDVIPFPGGQFLEYAVHHGQTEEYLQAARAAGYEWIEISDNVLEITLSQKADLIRLAREDYGLMVIGEVGSKVASSNTAHLIADIETCLQAGCWKVFVEAAEILGDGFNEALIEELVSAVPLEQLIFEVPGPWIPEVRRCDEHEVRSWLIKRFGPDVNLANVPAQDIISVETMRRGIGVAALRW